MKTITIGDVKFEVRVPRKNKLELASIMDNLHRHYSGRTIYQCYDRPSERKVAIFESWKKWAMENGNNVLYFEVSSYNCMQFTLSALYRDLVNEKWYSIKITRDSCVATLIEN